MATTATARIYYRDTYQDTLDTQVQQVGQNATGEHFVTFNETIFHPQGGGQPHDQGSVTINGKKYTVTKLEIDEESDTIRHYTQEAIGENDIYAPAHLTIDIEKRSLFARLHSAGHLLSNVGDVEFPSLDGRRGHHFPGEANVVFYKKNQEDTLPTKEAFKEALTRAVNQAIEADLPVVNSWEDSKKRTIQFGDFRAHPCGGTHVKKTGEIGQFTIRSVRDEKDKAKQVVGYKVGYDVKA